MRAILLLVSLCLSSPGFATLSVPFTQLQREDLEGLGLNLAVQDIAVPAANTAVPIFFTLTASNPDQCRLDDVYVLLNNAAGETLYGASVSRRNNQYDFQVHRDHVQYSTVSLVCLESGSAVDEKYYRLNLNDFIAPL